MTELWAPEAPEDTQMAIFTKYVNSKHALSIQNYGELYDWSVSQIKDFWAAVWDFCGIKSSVPFTDVYDSSVTMDKIPKWFLESRLNFAENVLKFRDDRLAIISCGEGPGSIKLTYRELYDQVEKCASGLRHAGVTMDDVVVGYIPNCPEAVIAMLACSSIGAIWSSASPDFGVTGVLDRFGQVKPKVIFSVNAVWYNGRAHDHLSKLNSVVADLQTLQKVVIIPFIDQDHDISNIKNSTSWDSFLNTRELLPLSFEQMPFHHPLVILYSSGTTGKPKCIVHSAGGVLIQHLKEHVIHGSMTRDDVFFYYTTTGWMMWNWLIGGLAVGCTIVLYDGSPFKPSPMRLWELVDEHNITIFGTSAKYIQSLLEGGVKPAEKAKLQYLRTIYSTGSPLSPECFDFVYESIKKNVLLGSITGGTDIVSLFAGHNSAIPVYKGEIQCRCLGMKIEALDDSGNAIFDEPGDLVCSAPFPVMPVMMWDDKNGEKYRNAYFSKFNGKIWYHGDYVLINSKTGGVHMLGRSDGTLNPAGVRFGSAELYNIMISFPQVKDSLAVGQKRAGDERVFLFCKMEEGQLLSEELINQIKSKIRSQLSPRHVPSFILPIKDIPYTLTGKKVEVAVKKIISGEKVEANASLANPEALELFYNFSEIL